MTRFERELSGALGAFWKKNAEQEITKMQQRVDNDEIRTNANGGAFWNSNGNYLPADCAEILSHTDFPFSLEETNRARKAQNEAFLESYRKNYQGPTAEEQAEMRAAFGEGTTVVNVITGKRTRL
jgi:hypothetical protein